MTTMTEATNPAVITARYAEFAADYDVYLGGRREKYSNDSEKDLAFLNEMRAFLVIGSSDYEDLMRDIVNGWSEQDIKSALALQKELHGATYRSVRNFYKSFAKYIGRGMLKKPKKLFSDNGKLIALFRVTEAIYALEFGDRFASGVLLNREYDVHWIGDQEMLTFILDNHQHWETLVDVIAAGCELRPATLEYAINGVNKAVLTGAL